MGRKKKCPRVPTVANSLREALDARRAREDETEGRGKPLQGHRAVRKIAAAPPGDHLEDSGGINVDTGGRAEELLDLESFEAPNKSRDRYGKNGRRENRQSNLRRNIPQGPELPNPRRSSIAASNCLKAGISKMVITGTVVRVK